MNKDLKIGIVGAGIQGISNALFLQKKGFKVTIFDRDEPGSPAASYGNDKALFVGGRNSGGTAVSLKNLVLFNYY